MLNGGKSLIVSFSIFSLFFFCLVLLFFYMIFSSLADDHAEHVYAFSHSWHFLSCLTFSLLSIPNDESSLVSTNL